MTSRSSFSPQLSSVLSEGQYIPSENGQTDMWECSNGATYLSLHHVIRGLLPWLKNSSVVQEGGGVLGETHEYNCSQGCLVLGGHTVKEGTFKEVREQVLRKWGRSWDGPARGNH